MDSTALEFANKKLLLAANRGLLSKVAKQLDPAVSPQFVRMVFWGQRRSKRVEQALRKAMVRHGKRKSNGRNRAEFRHR